MIRMIAVVRVTVTVMVLLAGAPILLVALGGSPLPDHRPSAVQVHAWLDDPLLPQYVPGTARVVAWLIWTLLATLIISAGVLRARRWRWARLAGYLPGPVQGLAATLLGAATVTTAVGIPAAHAAPVSTGDPAAPEHPSAGLSAVAPTADRHGRSLVKASPIITVHRGDTLWDIAGDRLGDPHRWKQIYRLNTSRHRDMGGGRHIEPGWTLALPTSTAVPGHRPPRPGPAPTSPPPARTAAPGHPVGAGCTAAQAPTAPSAAGTSTAAPPTGPAASTGTPKHTPAAERGGAATSPTGPAGPADRPVTATPTPPAGSTLPASPTTPSPPPPTTTATPAPGDDGAVGGVPTEPGTAPTGSTGSTSRVPSGSSNPAPASSSPTGERGSPRGVSLLSGSWVDLGLALAIAAAVALVWAHRRRRYTHRSPSPDLRLDDPDLAPMPPAVTELRHGLRHPAPEPATDDAGRDLDTDDPDSDSYTGSDPDDGHHEPPHADGPAEGAPAPVVPALANPLSAVWPPAGLGLTGPGAEAAARGFLTAALAAGGVNDPDARTWVVMASATTATLLGTTAVTLPDTPRLTVTADLDEALELLEAQTLHRTRRVYRHEVDDVIALRQADPMEEPLPPIMLIADATTRHERTRITALLAQGQRLDIHGVLLGPWPDGNTVIVAADGTTTPAEGDAARHGSHPADVGRLAILDPAEAASLLKILAESHTGRPQAPAPAETSPPTPTTTETARPDTQRLPEPATADEPAAHAGTTSSDSTLASDTGHAADTVKPAPGTPQDPPALSPVPRRPVPVAAAGTPADEQNADDIHDPGDAGVADAEEAAPAPGRVAVTVLGAADIVDADPQRNPRKKSREVLVYLAVHDGSAAAEAILDDLLPDASAKAAPHRLHTYVSDLRAVLRHNGGPGTYITNPNKHYALNRDTIDIDLWRMRAALTDADTALTEQERIAALRRAVDAYAGPLAAGYDYEWIESYREGVRRQAYDACLALATALNDQPDDQLAVLTAGIGHHPYAEELYQAAMRAQAQLGHLDSVRALRRAVTRRLAEIDTEPSDDTITLADHLVAQLRGPGRGARLRPAPDSSDGAAA